MLKVIPPAGPFLLRTAGQEAISTPTIANASRVALALRAGVPSSAWGGATVHREDGQLVAVLSFNGRAWMPGGTNPEGRPIPDSRMEFDLTSEGAIVR